MPNTQPAPAVPGNQQPRPAPLTTPPSLRRPPPGDRPRTPRPINSRRREVKAPYPDLPETPYTSGGRVSRAEFDRATFLRAVAELQAANPLFSKVCAGDDRPLAMFLAGAVGARYHSLRSHFADWMENCGGMAGPGFRPTNGSAE